MSIAVRTTPVEGITPETESNVAYLHESAGYKLTNADRIANQIVPLDEIDAVLTGNYLVKKWLSQGASSMIYGPSNAGKTFVALDLAMHVAAGRSWRGCRVEKGNVIYIAAEGGFGIRNRLAAFIKDRPDFADAGFYLLPTGLDLHSGSDAVSLCQAIPTADVSLIVVDTLARCMGDGDENSTPDMGAFVNNIDEIRRITGAHVMVIHHSGKNADRGARGSTALKAAVDTEINVTVGRIATTKQRDMEFGLPAGFKLRSVTLGLDEDGDEVSSAVVDEASAPIPKQKQPTGRKAQALAALETALDDHGTMKCGLEFRGVQRVVTQNEWRSAFFLTSEKHDDDAKRKDFHWAKSELHKDQLVGLLDNQYAWKMDEPE